MITDQELAKKLADLEARDKRLRQQMTKQTELSKARAYIGSCTDMCPERERYLRLGFQMSVFERDENNQPDEYAMVKEYRRAGADQQEPLPHDLRTPKALETTMDYLICNLMDHPRSNSPELALEWYDFLWDRLRAIRKDITQQNICDQLTTKLVEQCTRFHVHSCYAMNRVKDFDVDMNKRNLNDCLQMLRQMYNDLKMNGICSSGELEYQKYDVLLHLDEDPLSTNVIMKTSNHRSSPEMRNITKIFSAFTNNDYYTFFALLEKANYMESCILSLYINKMRLICMKIIIAAACTSKQVVWYPVDIAMGAMRFDDLEDLKAFASALEIEVQEKNSRYFLQLHKDLLTCLRLNGTSLPPAKSKRLVENKMRGLSVGQLVYGKPELPDNPYRQQKPSSILVDQNYTIEPMDEEFIEPVEDTFMVPIQISRENKISSCRLQDRIIIEPKPMPSAIPAVASSVTRRLSPVVSQGTTEDKVSINSETLVIGSAPKETADVFNYKPENRVSRVKPLDREVVVTRRLDENLTKSPRLMSDFSLDQNFQVDESDSIVLQVVAEKNPLAIPEEEPRVTKDPAIFYNFPAGRFRKTFKRPSFKRPEPEPEEPIDENKCLSRPLLSKRARILESLKESISDESKANNNLRDIIMTL